MYVGWMNVNHSFLWALNCWAMPHVYGTNWQYPYSTSQQPSLLTKVACYSSSSFSLESIQSGLMWYLRMWIPTYQLCVGGSVHAWVLPCVRVGSMRVQTKVDDDDGDYEVKRHRTPLIRQIASDLVWFWLKLIRLTLLEVEGVSRVDLSLLV